MVSDSMWTAFARNIAAIDSNIIVKLFFHPIIGTKRERTSAKRYTLTEVFRGAKYKIP
jgi:hypothetical protein